jgi:membrane protease YdiL (CAAX protease family)
VREPGGTGKAHAPSRDGGRPVDNVTLQYVQLALLVFGALLWIIALARGRALEWFTAPSRLPPWVPLASEFLVFVVTVYVAMVGTQYLSIWLFKIDTSIEPTPARTALILGFALQASWLGTALGFRGLGLLRMTPADSRVVPSAVAGVGGYFLAFPVVAAVALAWEALLRYLEVPMPPQDSIQYIRQAKTVVEVLPWFILVVIGAPLVEEILFRKVFYRFLASRVPETLAVVLSSALFGVFHLTTFSIFPLTILGVALCLAYRYTGRLITPIVMHVLFNLGNFIFLKFGG